MVPTPLRPTLNWNTSLLYFAPVLMIETQSTTFPSGIPLPKSRTETSPLSMRMSMRLPCPMMNSSMELSMSSFNRI